MSTAMLERSDYGRLLPDCLSVPESGISLHIRYVTEEMYPTGHLLRASGWMQKVEAGEMPGQRTF